MIWLWALLLFVGCAAIAYAKFILGAIIAFAFPPLVGVAAWAVLSDPIINNIERATGIVMFLLLVIFVELALLVGNLLHVA